MDKHLDASQLCDYAEGLLDAAARTIADKHLQACEACRHELTVTAAYFRSVGELEPVKAPADFLVKVRARIDKPSPWKTLWMALSTPWRFVPAQLALLTILGVTIMTAYFHQNGSFTSGAKDVSVVPESLEPQSPPEAPQSPTLTERANSPVELLKKSTPSSLNKDAAAKTLSRSRPKPQSPPKLNLPDDIAQSGAAAGSAAEYAKEANALADQSVPAPIAAQSKASSSLLKSEETQFRPNQPNPAVSAAPPAAAPRRVPPSPAPIMTRRSAEPPAEKERNEVKSESMKPESMNQSTESVEADMEVADKRQAEEAVDDLDTKGMASGRVKSKAGVSNAPPGFIVHLRAMQDTAAIWSGLKAMGAEKIIREPGQAVRYLLRIPTATPQEVQAFLERYGKTERQGAFPPNPASRQDAFFLQFILPP